MTFWHRWQAHYQSMSGWQRMLLDGVLVTLLLMLVLLWNTRHLLDTHQPAPVLQGLLLATPPAAIPDQAAAHAEAQQHYQVEWHSPRTLVYFFAPWCNVCRVSMPELQWLPSEGLQIVAVALDWQSGQEVAEMIRKTGFTGTVLLANSDIARSWQIRGYPTYYVVDQQGYIRHQDTGLTTPPGLWLRTR